LLVFVLKDRCFFKGLLVADEARTFGPSLLQVGPKTDETDGLADSTEPVFVGLSSRDIAAARSFLHFSMHRPCSVHLSYCGQITDEALIGVCWHRARASTSSLFRSAWHDWAKF